MDVKILLNDRVIQAMNYKDTVIKDETTNEELQKVSFDFHVTSDEYHDITVLLYKNNFAVEVPERNLSFQATILNYSTSITDLYKSNQTGLFHLELLEKVEQ